MQTIVPEIAVVLLCAAAVALRRHNAVLFLVAFGVTADCIAFRVLGPVMPVHRIVGVFVALEAFTRAPGMLRRHPALKALALYMAQMAGLAILYGWLVPWDDGNVVRDWNQRAAGRSVVSLARQFADAALMVYVAYRTREARARDWVLLGLVAGLAANALVAFIDLTTGARAVVAIFTGTDIAHTSRQGGLNVEPRALGRIAAVGLALALAMPMRRKLRLGLAGTAVVCLALAASTSAIVGLGFAVGAYALVGGATSDVRRLLVTAATVSVAVGVIAATWGGEVNEDVKERVETLSHSSDAEPGEPELVARLEVFDRAAARFLLANPEHAIIGTGPDLISLPASSYVAGSARSIYGERIDSVPHTWLISTIANGGLLGLVLMGVFAIGLAREARTKGIERGWSGFAVMLFTFSALVMSPAFWMCVGLLMGRLDAYWREVREPVPGTLPWRAQTQL